MPLYRAALYHNDGSDPTDGQTIHPSDTVLVAALDEDLAVTVATEYWQGTIDDLIASGNCEPDAPGIGIELLPEHRILFA